MPIAQPAFLQLLSDLFNPPPFDKQVHGLRSAIHSGRVKRRHETENQENAVVRGGIAGSVSRFFMQRINSYKMRASRPEKGKSGHFQAAVDVFFEEDRLVRKE